jgi:hypothetical protein
VIQGLALLIAGLAAAGIWLTDGFALLVACWGVGSIVHAGLVTALGTTRVREIAREVFLGEMLGGWVLLMSGLNLVLATNAVDLATPGPLPPRPTDLVWTGIGLLMASTARLGLPPFAPWPTRLAATPPLVRVFMHAAIHPATALMLWWRLDGWLLGWHRDVAAWLGASMALVAAVSAAGERLPPRRAALISIAGWSALLGLGAHGPDKPMVGLAVLALGLMAVHLAAAAPRWPRSWRRTLLGVAVIALLGLGWRAATASPSPPDLVVVGSLAVLLLVLVHWVATAAPAREAAESPRSVAVAALAPLARRSRDPGPIPRLATAVSQRLARGVAVVDRVVLDGIFEGIALIGLGAGWLIAWCDRRGMDLLEYGLTSLTGHVGRASRRLAGSTTAQLMLALMATALVIGLASGWNR